MMDIYIKVAAGILITSVIGLILSKENPDLSLLLTILVCCMVVISAISYLIPVTDFLKRLINVGNLSSDLLSILLKVAGIGFISQIAEFICADAGNRALQKALQMITTSVILFISVPLMEQILSLIEKILGEV